MKIRKATFQDIARINEISERGLYQEWKMQYLKDKKKVEKGVNEDMKFHIKTIRKNLVDKKQHWIVLEEDKILGFGGAYIKDKKGVIESIYVAKDFQRRGYGKRILSSLIIWLKSKKVGHIDTNILVKNIPSIKLHEKLGFEPYILKMRLR